MEKSKGYEYLIHHINATLSEKADGYNENLFNEIYDWEREEVEDLIWNTYYKDPRGQGDILVLFPELQKYDGIGALKKTLGDHNVSSYIKLQNAFLLYQNTEEKIYLRLIEKIIVESGYDYTYIAAVEGLKPSEEVYQLFVRIYESQIDSIALSVSIDALLFNKGFIKDIYAVNQRAEIFELRRLFAVPLDQRRTMIAKLEKGEFDQYKQVT